MSLWLDTMYLKMIAPRIPTLKEKRIGNLWNCRCTICGDSAKKLNKMRGYFISKGNQLVYMCHNCGASMSFAKYLRQFDFNLYEQYNMEKFKETAGDIKPKTKVTAEEKLFEAMKQIPKTQKFVPDVMTELKAVSELSSSHPARVYVEGRNIPEQFYKELYYAPKFFKWASGHSDKFNSVNETTDHPRMVIPWYTEEGMLFAYSARSYGKEEPRYYNIVLDETKPKFYGLNRVDWNKKVYVLEGQIDSLFLPNAVAVGNASLYHFTMTTNATYIPDRDVRNPDIMKIVRKMVKQGLSVCMLPHSLQGKDINEMVSKNNLTKNELLMIIDNNTFSGLEAELYFTKWSKV